MTYGPYRGRFDAIDLKPADVDQLGELIGQARKAEDLHHLAGAISMLWLDSAPIELQVFARIVLAGEMPGSVSLLSICRVSGGCAGHSTGCSRRRAAVARGIVLSPVRSRRCRVPVGGRPATMRSLHRATCEHRRCERRRPWYYNQSSRLGGSLLLRAHLLVGWGVGIVQGFIHSIRCFFLLPPIEKLPFGVYFPAMPSQWRARDQSTSSSAWRSAPASSPRVAHRHRALLVVSHSTQRSQHAWRIRDLLITISSIAVPHTATSALNHSLARFFNSREFILGNVNRTGPMCSRHRSPLRM